MASKKNTTSKTTTQKQTETQKAAETQPTETTTAGEGTTETTKTDDTTQQTTQETGDQTNEPTQGDDGQNDGTTQDPAATTSSDDEQQDAQTEEEADTGLAGEIKDAGLKQIAYRFDQYVADMDPKVPQTTETLLKHQLKLRTLVNNVLDLPDEKFADGWKMLIKGIGQNRKGAFSESHLFRGFPQLRVARAERQKLELLLSLLLASSDSKSPKKVPEVVDLNVVFRYLSNNDQQQKLQSFYGE